MAEKGLHTLIAKLEEYSQAARDQVEAQPEQASYWRGVLFGLDLALLEARKQIPMSDPAPVPWRAFYEEVSKLVFDHLENLITLCRSPIKRDLLVYNAQVTRYELLKAIRHEAGEADPGEYEWQARPGIGGAAG